MASLTGTKIKDTYDGLLKTTDNGVLGASAKLITDGLGNSSGVYLGTSGNVGIGTSTVKGKLHSWQGDSGQSSVNSVANGLVIEDNAANGISILTPSTEAGNIFFGDESDNFVGGIRYFHSTDSLAFEVNNDERMRINSSGNVGIGTSSPSSLLSLYSSQASLLIANSSGTANTTSSVKFSNGSEVEPKAAIFFEDTLSNNRGVLHFAVNSSTLGTPVSLSDAKLTISNVGNVGIGTSSPAVKLDVVGQVRASTGILFGSDTAAANALDDYEEGTWTPTLGGTWITNPTDLVGYYTKIGNMVYIRLEFTGGVKASTTAGWFNGLPFSGAVGGGGTVSNVSVQNKGIALLDNSTRVWVTDTDFGGIGAKVMASYRL